MPVTAFQDGDFPPSDLAEAEKSLADSEI